MLMSAYIWLYFKLTKSIPVMYGRRISKISDNLEDYPAGTVWMTIGELEKLKQSKGKGGREEHF